MKNISVIGAGTMGNGIAHVFAQNGFKVSIVDVSLTQLDRAIATISKNFDRQIAKGTVTEEEKKNALANISIFSKINDGVKDAELVVEAATENIELKLKIFEEIDKFAPKQTILASNTSSISITKNVTKNNPVDTVSAISKQNKTDLSITQVKGAKRQNRVPEKLKCGLNFSTGSSVITQNRFSLKARGNSVSDSYNAPGSVTGGGGSGAGFINAPSSNRSSFAFKAGLALKKNLTRRSSLSMSIDYAYLADKIKIGTKQNVSPQGNNSSSITSYYSSVRLKTFTDRFHFIELPIMYDWCITGNPNHFISLDIGTSVAYLISTNAVVYDTISGGIYYHDKDLFHKTHINFMSGLSYHSIGKRSFEWCIEPQFSFDVTRIFKANLDTRKYFLYTGIGATIFFEKQKKK